LRRRHTVGSTLRDRLLAAAAANTHAVDDIALLGLVSQTTSLIRARGTRGTVNDVQLAELY
jgi:multisubunit Na+/H+ antiporter MnhF subunit